MLAIKSIPIYFILLLAPVLWHLDHSLPGITAGFVGVLLLVICSVLFFKHRGCRFNLVDLLFVLFVVWYVGRTVGTVSSMYTWKLLLGSAAIILYAYVRNIELKAIYFNVLFIAGIFQAIWFFVQLLGLFPSYNYLYPGTGGFMNPAILAVFLAIACLAGVVGFYYKERVYVRVLRGGGSNITTCHVRMASISCGLGWFNARHFMDRAGRKAMEIYPFLGKYVQTISFWEVYSILVCDCHFCKRDLCSLFVTSGFRAGTFFNLASCRENVPRCSMFWWWFFRRIVYACARSVARSASRVFLRDGCRE